MEKEKRPYVLWRRVSTEAQGKSELGLEAQLEIAKYFMGKEPTEMFTDIYSGTKLSQCTGLRQAIELCKQTGHLLVVAKSDRFRNLSEALEIFDEMNPSIDDDNIRFCDIPTHDKYILSMMWGMWERQAIMGRINTKLALKVRKRQIKENGGFFSKSGRYCTHLGNKKGVDTSAACRAAGIVTSKAAEEWRSTSPLFLLVENMVRAGKTRKEILAETTKLYNAAPKVYCTRTGKPLTEALLSIWINKYINYAI